jgi:hypothetical protein
MKYQNTKRMDYTNKTNGSTHAVQKLNKKEFIRFVRNKIKKLIFATDANSRLFRSPNDCNYGSPRFYMMSCVNDFLKDKNVIYRRSESESDKIYDEDMFDKGYCYIDLGYITFYGIIEDNYTTGCLTQLFIVTGDEPARFELIVELEMSFDDMLTHFE